VTQEKSINRFSRISAADCNRESQTRRHLAAAQPNITVNCCGWIWANSKYEQTVKFRSSLSLAAECKVIHDFSHILRYWTLHILLRRFTFSTFKPLKPSGHCMYRQFNIQQFYVLPTQCMCFCGSQNKQQLFPYTPLTGWFL